MREVESVSDHRWVDGSLLFLVHWARVLPRPTSKAGVLETSWCACSEVGHALCRLEDYLKTTDFSVAEIRAILHTCKASTDFAALGDAKVFQRLSADGSPLQMPTTAFSRVVKDAWLIDLAASLRDILPTDYVLGSACKELVRSAKPLLRKCTPANLELFKLNLFIILRARPTAWDVKRAAYEEAGYFA